MRCGIILPSLIPSQLAFYMVNHANSLMSKSVKNQFIFFLNDISPFYITPLCPCLSSAEILQFNDGTIITTTISDTLKAIKTPHNSKIKFYVWDLEWIRKQGNFFENIEAFRNSKVEVIARSHEHAKMIKNYANIDKVRVIEDCNLEAILCQ